MCCTVDGVMGIGDAAVALEIVDIDGDGRIGMLDFIHFAARLKAAHEVRSGINSIYSVAYILWCYFNMSSSSSSLLLLLLLLLHVIIGNSRGVEEYRMI